MPRLLTAFAAFMLAALAPAGALLAALVWDPPALHSHETRLAQIAGPARARLAPCFRRAGVAYPPARVVLAALKRERLLRLYAAAPGGTLRYIRDYRIVGSSGGPGPKLAEGDGQVPEGIYPVGYLNPNSAVYLSLQVGYPNAFDRRMASREGRQDLGGDIMIHGPSRAARGCLALSQRAIEEVYVAAADAGADATTVIISPVDFATGPPPVSGPAWTSRLYTDIAAALDALPSPLETWRLVEAESAPVKRF